MEALSREEQAPAEGSEPVAVRRRLPGAKRLFLVLEALTRELGHRPMVSDYRELRERDPGLPSFAEIHDGYGSWNATLEQAGLAADDESPVWREILLGEGKDLQVDVSSAAIYDLVEQVRFLQEVADEQGIDLWAGSEWIAAEWDEDWVDYPLARD